MKKGARKLSKDWKFYTGFNALVEILKKIISVISGSKITLTDNEIKDIVEIIRYSENRGILLKGTTRKITSQEEGFLNFLRPLMTQVC